MNPDQKLPLLRTIARLLTFRITQQELDRLDVRFLAAGFLGTWLVGIGRHWDAPDPNPAQLLGLGSLVYVLVLSLLLFLIGIPLQPRNWSLKSVLTFVTLTSFPAALYAIPVERFTPVETAAALNVAFLAIVATYRVALYLFYMARSAELGALTALVAAFLPITVIISFLFFSGMTGAVFDIMAGIRERVPTAQDGVNSVLAMISFTSCISVPLLVVTYVYLINVRSRRV